MARSCAVGTQTCSKLASLVLLLSDHATMGPAAIAESLTTIQSILHACNVSVDVTCALGDATATFLETLLSHILRGSLVQHVHASACQLPQFSSKVDVQSSQCIAVLAWLVLFWQALESHYDVHVSPSSLLADQMIMNTVVEIFSLMCTRFRTPQVAGILTRCVASALVGNGGRAVRWIVATATCRTLFFMWGSSVVDRTFQQHPDRFLVFADLLLDLTVCPSELPDIAAMLRVPPECLRSSGTSYNYALMHAIAVSAPGAALPCLLHLLQHSPCELVGSPLQIIRHLSL